MTSLFTHRENHSASGPSNALPPDVDTKLLARVALIGFVGSFLLCASALVQGRTVVATAVAVNTLVIAANFFVASRSIVSFRLLHISAAIIAVMICITMVLSGVPTPAALMLISLIPFVMAALGNLRGMLFWLAINALILVAVYLHAPYATAHYVEPSPMPSVNYYMSLSALTLFLTATAYVLMGRRNHHANHLANLNAELTSTQEIAKNANESKGQFLGRLSHELRVPLNAMVYFSDVIADDRQARLSPDQMEKLQHIKASAQSLRRAVEQILEITKHDQRSGYMALLPVAIKNVVASAAAEATEACRERNITLNIDAVSLEAIQVIGEAKLIGQIVAEIIANAIHFNRIGGQVDIGAQVDDQSVRLNITDNGYGIPKAAISELFEPFNRVEETKDKNKHRKGASLGLALVRSLTERINGRIEVQSEPGLGSTFTLVLPVYIPTPTISTAGTATYSTAAGDTNNSQTGAADGRPDVIYVDDNHLHRLVMSTMFDELDLARLHMASDATAGLAMAQAIKPAVLLLDIHLPEFDGIELLARIRANNGLKDIPAIAVSSDAMPAQIEAAMASGFDGYLIKPVGQQILQATLAPLLTRSKQNLSS